jgi:hypothetical protein
VKTPNEQPAPQTAPRLILNPVLAELPTYPLAKIDERRHKLEDSGATLYDFGTGDPANPQHIRFVRPSWTAYLRPALPERRWHEGPARSFRGLHASPPCRRARSRQGGLACRRFQGGHLPRASSLSAPFPRAARVVYGTPGYPVYERGTLFAGGELCP